jgi:hypothetical protein
MARDTEFKSTYKALGLRDEYVKMALSKVHEVFNGNEDDPMVGALVVGFFAKQSMDDLQKSGKSLSDSVSNEVSSLLRKNSDVLTSFHKQIIENGDKELKARSQTIAKLITDEVLKTSELKASSIKKEAKLNTQIKAGLGLLVGCLVLLVVGYLGGMETSVSVSNQLSAVVLSGEEGSNWLRLIKNNDLERSMEVCHPGNANYSISSGVPVCAVPVWLEKPPGSPNPIGGTPNVQLPLIDKILGLFGG